jgi:hypothetical protein
MDVVVLIIFGLLALLLFGFQTKTVLELSVLSIGAFVVLIVLLLFVLYNKKFGFRLFQSLRKLPLIRRLPEDFMKNFYDSKIKTQKLSFSFILTVIAWFLDGAVLYLTLLSLGISLNPLMLVGLLTLAVLIGIASTLPGGLGSTEAVMILLLGAIGVQSTTAVAGAILSRFISFWYPVLVGGMSFVYLSKKIDMKKIL